MLKNKTDVVDVLSVRFENESRFVLEMAMPLDSKQFETHFSTRGVSFFRSLSLVLNCSKGVSIDAHLSCIENFNSLNTKEWKSLLQNIPSEITIEQDWDDMNLWDWLMEDHTIWVIKSLRKVGKGHRPYTFRKILVTANNLKCLQCENILSGSCYFKPAGYIYLCSTECRDIWENVRADQYETVNTL